MKSKTQTQPETLQDRLSISESGFGPKNVLYRLILPFMFLACNGWLPLEEADPSLWCGVLLILILIADRWKPAWILRGTDLLIAAALISPVIVCLGTDWLSVADTSLTEFFSYEGCGIFFFLLSLYLYQYHRKDFLFSLRILSWILLLSVIAAFYQYYEAALEYMESNEGSLDYIINNRMYPPYGHAILAAHSWVIGLWLPLTGYRKVDIFPKILYVAGIFLTQSRSSWIALAVSIVLWLIYEMIHLPGFMRKIRWWQRLLVVAAIAAAAAALIYLAQLLLQNYYVQEILVKRLVGIEDTASYKVRTSYAAFLLEEFSQLGPIQQLVGCGRNSMVDVITNSELGSQYIYTVADNTYISLLYEYGILSVAAVALVMWKAVVDFFRTPDSRKVLSRGTLALLGGFISVFFYDVQFYSAQFLLMMALGAVVVVDYRERKAAAKPVKTPSEEETQEGAEVLSGPDKTDGPEVLWGPEAGRPGMEEPDRNRPETNGSGEKRLGTDFFDADTSESDDFDLDDFDADDFRWDG